MEKTKLGISVGLFGAFIYIAAMYGGYTAAILLTGYVLLMESNEWLKKAAIKAVATLACFSFIFLLLNVIPDAINIITSAINVFGANLYFNFINNVFNVLDDIVNFVRNIVFILLAYKALTQGTIKIPVVDKLIEKYM